MIQFDEHIFQMGWNHQEIGDEVPPVIEIPQVSGWAFGVGFGPTCTPYTWSCLVTQLYHEIMKFGVYLFIVGCFLIAFDYHFMFETL